MKVVLIFDCSFKAFDRTEKMKVQRLKAIYSKQVLAIFYEKRKKVEKVVSFSKFAL